MQQPKRGDGRFAELKCIPSINMFSLMAVVLAMVADGFTSLVSAILDMPAHQLFAIFDAAISATVSMTMPFMVCFLDPIGSRQEQLALAFL